jgi:hypothetical protein
MEHVLRLEGADETSGVEFTVWFTPDGTVPLEPLMDLIVANLNALPVRGVNPTVGFHHPFAKQYPAE